MIDIQDRVKDDYLANRILRDKFRKRKKELKAKKDADAAVLKKNSLDIGLVDECPEDVKFAQLLSIQVQKHFVLGSELFLKFFPSIFLIYVFSLFK